MARLKKHPKYYAIEAYQILSKKSDKDMAKLLGISTRTYKDRINGYSDFSCWEGETLAKLFGKSKDDIFLT